MDIYVYIYVVYCSTSLDKYNIIFTFHQPETCCHLGMIPPTVCTNHNLHWRWSKLVITCPNACNWHVCIFRDLWQWKVENHNGILYEALLLHRTTPEVVPKWTHLHKCTVGIVEALCLTLLINSTCLHNIGCIFQSCAATFSRHLQLVIENWFWSFIACIFHQKWSSTDRKQRLDYSMPMLTVNSF